MPDIPLTSPLKPANEWHSRHYVPHWEAGETPQAITLRLADSFPATLRAQLQAELLAMLEEARPLERRRLLERVLDQGRGEAILAQENVGSIIEDALLFFDGTRYRLHAWCVMPNHVHVLVTPVVEFSLSALVHSWKSYTGNDVNHILGRKGQRWFEEYYDRKIRTERHFEAVRFYIEQNPVKAGLCTKAEDWMLSSAWIRK